MTSEISFDYQPGSLDRADVHQIMPRIDSIPLIDLVDTFEIGAGMEPSGDMYGGLAPQFFRFDSATEHFHGSRKPRKTPVLACSCGEVGCWPLFTRISLTGDLVVWDHFEQPHRPTRDYTAFGPFLFDRIRYDTAIQDLSTAIESHKASSAQPERTGRSG
ncbi:hypothetical protein [Nocardia rosealba]|uniref:hypothetical protein n=1 Tax=Nocardia rosealba TaxID=2878563 RepID=UPI001CDA3524|nr:hypothetical protein [Nocardia rosealba]MCA2205738.1 hypothetical protein [Nocardia rosealba]